MPGPGSVASAPLVRVALMVALAPRRVFSGAHLLPAGTTVGQALQAAAAAIPPGDAGQAGVLHEALGEALEGRRPLAVWGVRADLARPLVEGDRLEVLRPLVIQPGEARRLRARKRARAHGAGA